jgi:hypothetical protein
MEEVTPAMKITNSFMKGLFYLTVLGLVAGAIYIGFIVVTNAGSVIGAAIK